jgi:anti-sigma regulatory factor (Ser/Thr protein kinase)
VHSRTVRPRRTSDTGEVDQEKPDEVGADARIVEEAAASHAVAPEPSSVKTAPVYECEPSNTALEQEAVSELIRPPDEVIPEDTQLVETVAERPAMDPQSSTVEITPLSELDPSVTALEPELASELERRADEVIVEAAAGESPVPQPADTASRLPDEVLDGSKPVAAARGPDPPDAEVAGPPEVFRRTFPGVAASIADARRFAVRALADIPADVVEDIRLMVSELASNAIEHAMAGFQLTIRCTRQEIRVEVTDSGGGTPAMRATGPDALKGRGLQIVNMRSTRWGVEQEPDSAKTVWFTRAYAPTAGPDAVG